MLSVMLLAYHQRHYNGYKKLLMVLIRKDQSVSTTKLS